MAASLVRAPGHEEFDLERLGEVPERVKRVVADRVANIDSFASLRIPHLSDDLSSYRAQVAAVRQPAPLDRVWSSYATCPPSEMFSGPMLEFLFAYSRAEARFYYGREADALAATPGVQLYSCLRILGPRFLVGVEVLAIEHEERRFEVAYLESGMFSGVQTIDFSVHGEHTRVTHTSRYKSGVRFHDAVSYPFFHRLTTREYHRNMRRLLQRIEW